jgi:hypothetical protein
MAQCFCCTTRLLAAVAASSSGSARYISPLTLPILLLLRDTASIADVHRPTAAAQYNSSQSVYMRLTCAGVHSITYCMYACMQDNSRTQYAAVTRDYKTESHTHLIIAKPKLAWGY